MLNLAPDTTNYYFKLIALQEEQVKPSVPYSPPSLESRLHNSTESVELLLIYEHQRHNAVHAS